MRDSFFVTLNSDNSEYYKLNRAARFQVHLGQMHELEGAWEVALAELRIPTTLRNFRDTTIVSKVAVDLIDAPSYLKVVDYMPAENYVNVKDLIDDLNKKFAGRMKFSVDKDGKVVIEQHESAKSLVHYYFPDHLKDILGLERHEIIGMHNIVLGKYPVNLNKGIVGSLSVHANIIEHQIMDHTHTNIMRNISTSAHNYKFGYDKIYTFEKLFYMPVVNHRMETLEIHISDGKGMEAPFNHGTSTAVLRFRRSAE
jgi:hypothetical protein